MDELEELLQPNRELLAKIRLEIASLENETKTKINRAGDDEAREIWHQFGMAIEPLRHEQERILKTIVDCYATQPLPQMVLSTTLAELERLDTRRNDHV